jgi:hypothetical protein
MYWTLQDEIAEAEMLQLNLGKCEGRCQRDEDVPRVEYRENRMDSDKTYMLCGWCATEDEEYWDEMWRDYWSSRL